MAISGELPTSIQETKNHDSFSKSLQLIRKFSDPDNFSHPLTDGQVFADLIPPKLIEIVSNPLAIQVKSTRPGELGVRFSVHDTQTQGEVFRLHASTFPDTPQSLHVWNIEVAESLRGNNIARSFYENLAPLARKENFRYITGEQRPHNREIFRKLGRIPYNELSNELQQKIFSRWLTNIDDPESYMEIISGLSAEFLYPEERKLRIVL